MGIYFFDSSAIVKYYVREQGSDWVTRILDPSVRHQIHVARVSGVEVIAAIAKRIRMGHIASDVGTGAIARFRTDFARRPRLTEISPTLIGRAMDLVEKHALRGYDAIQLAAAMEVHAGAMTLELEMTIVAADDELNAAAAAEGLRFENPNSHP